VKSTKVQVVTSAFRPIPVEWASLPNLQITVSIDGLQPEHDVRRAPATYQKILRNIEGQHACVHCTITSAMVKRDGYIDEFVDIWSANANVEKIWMSIFTPQRGAKDPEILSVEERRRVVEILLRLRESRPKLDMPALVINEFLRPPQSPEQCVFASTTQSISADFKTPVVPCQFGGDPDCSQCGCVASMGMAAVGNHKLVGRFTIGDILWTSNAIGGFVQRAGNWMRAPMGSNGGSSNGAGIHGANGSKDLLKVLR
jgi:MoaA/NifB/PqqE/SkfB family radical SAM enzyme